MLIFFHTPKFLKLSLETRWAKQSMRKFLLSIVHPKVTSRRELTITGRKGKAHHWRSRWRSDSKTSVRSIEGKAFSRRGNSLNTSRNLQTYSAAAKPLQSCLTLCDPHRRQPIRLPLSLGFSKQEHWSGLSFPSPMHESEEWKWSRSIVSDS